MPGIGRLKNKISVEREEEIKPAPLPAPEKTVPPSQQPQPEKVSPPLKQQKPKKTPLSPTRKQLYQKIVSGSQKEKLEQKRFLARIQEKSEPGEESSFSPDAKEKAMFQPVPQGPSRTEKIFVRLLIVLLIASLGFLLYLVFRGYLI